MASRRHLRKEEEEELKRQKKELKKSYEKTRPTSKKVGAKRVSDTQKYVLVGSVAIVIILIVAIQFLIPPPKICNFSEQDFVYATLDQDTQKINFNRIIAYYSVRPEHTTIDCDITDYFNATYSLAPQIPPPHSGPYASSIVYQLGDVVSQLTWACVMENGTKLQMTPWINKTVMTTNPLGVNRFTPTNVNFRLAITTQVQVDRYNASLKFNLNIPNTKITFWSITDGTNFFSQNGTIFTQGVNLSAKSTILLNFILQVNSSQPLGELNLLQSGSVYLVKNNQLLESYTGASAFKESEIDFTGFGLGQEPTLKKSKSLNIVVNIPYYNVTVIS
ncbi:MAG: hypothetical protein LUQ65_11820 [Candidatus Helarchaeota archaeon]|nr:hypothetical protein [Candidatus Helarchaeota archaeon]